MEKRRIAVIFGGCSSEHEVSRLSAKCVIDNIPKEKYEIIPIYISKEGKWYQYTKRIEEIEVLEENNENQERKQEEDKEGYVARKNQN